MRKVDENGYLLGDDEAKPDWADEETTKCDECGVTVELQTGY